MTLSIAPQFSIRQPVAAQVLTRRGPAHNPPTDQRQAHDPVRLSGTQKTAFERRESTALSLQLQTAEGDSINININSLSNLYKANSTGSNGAASRFAASAASQVEVRVQGDLSAAEEDAVNRLLASINRIAQGFFSADTSANSVERTLSALDQLDFDAQQLSAMALDLSLQQTTQYVQQQSSRLPLTSGYAAANPAASGTLSELIQAFAEAQKSLVAAAGKSLEPVSAARLAREVLPELIVAKGRSIQERADGPPKK